ncbi:glycosyltransferase family 4 protein [Streptomyces sp. NPDC005907]
MKICFLLHNAYAIGGTVRSTLNLAGALAVRHEVEIVSVFRTDEKPLLGISAKVRLTPLVDERPDAAVSEGESALMARPSEAVPPTEVLAHRYSALSDERLRAFLAATDADVVVATRPALVVFLAQHGARRYLRIGQEHLSYDNHVPEVRAALNQVIGHLDAFVTVSAQDAADHRARLPRSRTRIIDIPNAAPKPKSEPSDGRAPLVMAAGRLMPVKRYDLLIEAFASVVAVRPEWQLRIYGQGPERSRLRALIDTLGLSDHAFLMGAHPAMETEWPKASVAAVSSDWESFGMTILEAMHAGVPVVATDCPHGPGEIITAGFDGILVPAGDPDAFAAALLKSIDDEGGRRHMGAAARATARRYAPRRIAEQYMQLIAELAEARTPAVLKLGRRLVRVAGVSRLPRPNDPSASQASAVRTSPTAHGRPHVLRPKATCRATPECNLSIAVSGIRGELLELLLTRRHGDDEVRVPLQQPDAENGPWTAELHRGDLDLSEGRWDLYVERSAGRPAAGVAERRRLKAALVEQRGLLAAAFPPDGAVTWWIPYTTKDGFLALRTFRRSSHAEVMTLRVEDDRVRLAGLLHGARLGEGAALLGVSRSEDAVGFETALPTVEGRRFEVALTSLPGPVGAEKSMWDLFLRPNRGEEPVRMGRIADDIVDRKQTSKYPEAQLATPTGASVGVRPFFTVTNDLTISAG